jgi:hypothetical protein
VGKLENFSAYSLERDAFRILELDSSAINYPERPVLRRYVIGGRKRTYRPDTLVRQADHLEFLEVKYEVDVETCFQIRENSVSRLPH